MGTFVPGRGLRDIQALTYHRRTYSEICRDLATGAFRPDVTIACTTPPGEDGSRSLGAIVGYLDLAVQASRTLVVEEVSWLPVVSGAAQVRHADDVVAAEAGLPETPVHFSAPFDAVDEAVAANVASLLPDNPRLALGIGRIPDALAAALAGRGDIDIITGVVTDTVRRLSETGALADWPIRSMSVVGPRSLLDWSAGENRVELSSSTTIHDPVRLSQQDRFVCALGALLRRRRLQRQLRTRRLARGLRPRRCSGLRARRARQHGRSVGCRPIQPRRDGPVEARRPGGRPVP